MDFSITELEKDEIPKKKVNLIFLEDSLNVELFLSEVDFQNFRKLVNLFKYNNRPSPSIHGQDQESYFYVDQDGREIRLGINQGSNAAVITFTRKQYEQFRQKINKFQLEES